jgi:Phosducin
MAQGVTTEWEDIQVKMGNWLPREKGPTNEEIAQAQLEEVEQVEEFKGRTKEQLEGMLEEKPDLEDDDEFLEAYRKKRLEELKRDKDRPRFGSQFEIQRSEFEVHVTRAPKDVICVITLYQNYIAESVKLTEILDRVAQRHPYVKFIKMVATKCIENYMDIDVPGILFYKNGDLMDKIIPAAPVFGGGQMNTDTVEFVLAMKQIIDAEFESDPRLKLQKMKINMIKADSAKRRAGHHGNEDESQSEEEDDREYLSNQLFKYKHHN